MKKLSMILFILVGLFINNMSAQDSIDILAPDGGESIDVASTYAILWTSVGTIIDVKIEYSLDGGSSWKVITYSTTNDGTYNWNVPYNTSTECLVRVTDVDGSPSGVSDSEFSIVDDGTPRIKVTSPNGGETLVAGTDHDITWQTTGIVGNVKIEYTTDNGTTWSDIAASTDNDGIFSWTVPSTASTQCLVRISEESDNSPTDTSNSVFTITGAGSDTLNLTFPNGGESLPGGFNQTITWTSSGTIFNVKLDYSTNNGTTWNSITNATPNDGSYSWKVPSVVSSQCLVRIRDALDGSPSDQSNSTFSIVAAGTQTITVLSPNGGEIFLIGFSQSITWLSTGSIDFVRIDYSTNNGSSWSNITASTSNDGAYSWTVPDTPSTQCLVRVRDAADSDPSDASNAVFTIRKSSDTISISSPSGGESWEVGSVHNITWTTYGSVGNVKIQYSTNNKSTWSTIVSSTANDGSYSWTVPNTPSTTCNVKISEAADGAPSNTSAGVFSIVTATGNPEISLSRTQLYFGSLKSSTAETGVQTVNVNNTGGGTLQCKVAADADWIKFYNYLGFKSGWLEIWVDGFGLAVGNHTGTIRITEDNASNSPQIINVKLTVYAPLSDAPPFGSFDTPAHGSTVRSSVPVTGWALDDIEIDKVTIWRATTANEGSGRVYIGDAVLVEGARPDVEAAYPGYPVNYKAGWGYMMLTNMLPNKGNGTFTLYAYAEDLSGHETLLGSKTITCDNAHAVKPFGAIDTPAQGGEASGANFRNRGWILTPMPNKIPENGSTLKVYIDGQYVGQPTYNVYRSDIAELFAGYANSDGASTYWDFDTTAYETGVHTIQWTAADNVGNTDGIGSRYFTIKNIGSDQSNYAGSRSRACTVNSEKLPSIPTDYFQPVGVRKGYNENPELRTLYPDENGIINVRIKELERLEIHFSNPALQASSLPIGSSLDTQQGIFYWQPGPGFLGKYRLVFFETGTNGPMRKKEINVTIMPKFSGTGEKAH